MRVLLLGGTAEARHIAVALSRESFLSLTISLAEPERRPQTYGWPLRIGGWGGDAAFRAFLERERFDGIIDATHPFARRMTERVSTAADEMDIPLVHFLRPAWTPSDGDRWVFLNKEADAAQHIPRGERVFLATGRRALEDFDALKDQALYCRVRDRPLSPFPFENGRYLWQQGPFTVKEEIDQFLRLGISWVVARNSGGMGSWPKIEAARELGLPVAMIRRPKQPQGLKIANVAETLAWVRRRL